MRSSALADVRNVLLAGLGVGAGARGLYGLYNLINRSNRGPEPTGFGGPLPTEMPVDDEEEKLKLAADGKPSWLSTGSGESKSGIPWYLLAGVGAGAGGAYGGWKIMDMILDKRRLQAQEDDLEEAQADFRSVLTNRGVKTSADGPTLGQDLDKLYDMLQEKAADNEKQAASFGDLGGKALSAYGLYGGVTGLAAGLWMYNIAKKRQRRALLDKAKKERERKRFERQPPAIEAFPSLPAPA
jgi:hypothetical protein